MAVLSAYLWGMETITLTISHAGVLDEVKKTTAYIGGKQDGGKAYDTVFVADADTEMLSRFLDEARADVCGEMRQHLTEAESKDGADSFTLSLSSFYNGAMTAAAGKDLFSFYVTSAVGKWLSVIGHGEAGAYTTQAAACLQALHAKLCTHNAPGQPKF